MRGKKRGGRGGGGKRTIWVWVNFELRCQVGLGVISVRDGFRGFGKVCELDLGGLSVPGPFYLAMLFYPWGHGLEG